MQFTAQLYSNYNALTITSRWCLWTTSMPFHTAEMQPDTNTYLSICAK